MAVSLREFKSLVEQRERRSQSNQWSSLKTSSVMGHQEKPSEPILQVEAEFPDSNLCVQVAPKTVLEDSFSLQRVTGFSGSTLFVIINPSQEVKSFVDPPVSLNPSQEIGSLFDSFVLDPFVLPVSLNPSQ